MLVPLASLLPAGDVRQPVMCPPGTSLKQALSEMQRRGVGSIVIATAAGRAMGILTERDLLRHTVAGRIDLEAPVDLYMTSDPVGLPAEATLWDAALTMARHGIRHLLITDQERIAGVVSERGLFALQRRLPVQVIRAIELAEDEAALVEAAARIRQLARTLLSQGFGAEQLTQLIVVLNDRLVGRVIAIEQARHGLQDGRDGQAAIRYCWLALGSEGRREQTFSTDQDNALVFDAGKSDANALRARLLPFARAVNRLLDACGFPLCRGGIMAGNPMWCLSVQEWREAFALWMRAPTPQALLNAVIFFDFRALHGDAELAEDLRRWLSKQLHGNERFLRMLAESALATRPPLGLFGNIAPSGGSLDLKAQGTRLFVDAARVLALATGSEATNTAGRLREALSAAGAARQEIEAAAGAFQFLLLLRLRQQQPQGGDGGQVSGANQLDPSRLNDLDRRILKESFYQARQLQRRLALDYRM